MTTKGIDIKKTQLRPNDKNEDITVVISQFTKLFKAYESNVY